MISSVFQKDHTGLGSIRRMVLGVRWKERRPVKRLLVKKEELGGWGEHI